MAETHLEMLNRIIDREVANPNVSLEVHASWMRQRAKLDRLMGDKPLRKLLEVADDAISRADADC